MRITKRQLRQIIKEEFARTNEAHSYYSDKPRNPQQRTSALSLINRVRGKDLVASSYDGGISFEILGGSDDKHISAEVIDQALIGSRYQMDEFLTAIIDSAGLVTDENGEQINYSDELDDMDSGS